MACYWRPPVIRPDIPQEGMTPLERHLLKQVFDWKENGDGIAFSASVAPRDPVSVRAAGLRAALLLSRGTPSRVVGMVERAVAEADPADPEIALDAIDWVAIFQDIVRRTPSLPYVAVRQALMCSDTQTDGPSGQTILITADSVRSKTSARPHRSVSVR